MTKDCRQAGAAGAEVLKEKEEKEKHAALWAGVFFFMALIIFLWVLNTKSLFHYLNFNKKDNFNIDSFSKEFNQSLEAFKKQTGDMKGELPPANAKFQISE